MSRPGNSEELEILNRRKAVADRYLKGEPQWKIGQSLEVSQATISRDLEAMQAEWKARCDMLTDQRMAEELAKIDAAEKQYWEGWRRSLRPLKRKGTKHKSGGEGETDETSLQEELRDGNPAFLHGILKCIEARCEILGILERKGPLEKDPSVIEIVEWVMTEEKPALIAHADSNENGDTSTVH